MQERKYSKSKYWQLLFFSGNETATTSGYNLVSIFFVLMMTDNLLLSGFVAGLIFTFSRVVDAITDPIIGTLIDKTVTRFGKFRPFIVLGSIIINIGILMMFGGFVVFENRTLMYLWVIFSYLLYIIGYTLQSTCTRSGQVQITNDPVQRPFLGAALATFSYIFYGLFLVYSIDFVGGFDGGFANPLGYRYLAFIVVAVNIFLTILSVIGIKEKDQPHLYQNYESLDEKITLGTIFNIIKNNKPLQALIVAAGTNKLAQMVTGGAMAYFFIYTVQNIDLQPVVATYGILIGIIGVMVGMYVASKWDKKKSFLLGTYLGIIAPILLIIFHPFHNGHDTLLIILLVAMLFANSIAYVNVLPMTADVADYEHYKRKRFVPGIIGTTFSFVDKLVSSLSGLIIGITLALINYESDMAPTTEAFWAFYIIVIIIPIIGHIASIIAFKWYEIDRDYYNKMITEINSREIN